MTKIKKKNKNKIFSKLDYLLFKSTYFPFVLTLTVMGILYVFFRMKSVEQDYKMHSYNKLIEEAIHENKELKAKKAKLLSSQNLRDLASKHNLTEPKQEQIIVIP